MKIFIIGSAHPLRGGGIATFNERMAEVLQAAGHEVRIISFTLQYPSFLFPGKSQFTDEPAPAGIQIQPMINSINPLNWLSVGNYIKNQKPDLVIVRYWLPFFGPSLGTILRRIKKNKHTKVISILDNVIPHESRIGDKAFTKYFLQPNDAFLTMSKEVMEDLKQFQAQQEVVFSPHPMYDNYGAAIDRNTALEKLGLDTQKQYILFFGFIRKYKGLDLLLDAMADPRVKSSSIELIIAGEYYGDEAFYKEKIKTLGIEDKIHAFTQFIPNAEVRNYFSAADAVVQPYRTATQSGISQIAYHFDKPMVVTDVGGLSEIVPNGKVGFVVHVDPTEIATAVLRLFEEGQLAKFAVGLKEEKKQYEWSAFLDKLLKL